MPRRARRIESLLKPYRVATGKGFRLRRFDPRDTGGLDKQKAKEYLQRGIRRLAAMQDKLYAQDQWGVLLIFQAMDAAGKDGAIKHVMSGINPQGCQVYSFKAPSAEELDHDFFWRTSRALPERGRIGIFNRSYYEEVLVVRVHPQILAGQRLPKRLVTKRIWDERFEDICAFERYLARQGYLILKFFLHVSKKAQKERFLERLDRPEKNWKFSLADANERDHFGAYMRAYEDLIRATAAPHAPWYVVPADRKWFTRLLVAAAIHDALERLDLAYPKVDAEKKKELMAARAVLVGPRAGRARAAGRSPRAARAAKVAPAAEGGSADAASGKEASPRSGPAPGEDP
jgi:PPK2 family polyphosphate:nucleotide phosphotransferase